MAGERNFWSLVRPDQTVTICVSNKDSDLIILSLVSDINIVFKSAEGVFEILYRQTCPSFDCQVTYFLGEIGFRFRPDGRAMESVAEPGRVFATADAMKVFDEVFSYCSLPVSRPSLYELLRQGAYPN